MSFRLPHDGGLASALAINDFDSTPAAPSAAPPRNTSRRVSSRFISLLLSLRPSPDWRRGGYRATALSERPYRPIAQSARRGARGLPGGLSLQIHRRVMRREALLGAGRVVGMVVAAHDVLGALHVVAPDPRTAADVTVVMAVQRVRAAEQRDVGERPA